MARKTPAPNQEAAPAADPIQPESELLPVEGATGRLPAPDASGAGGRGIAIVNALDPDLVAAYLATPAGEDFMQKIIARKATAQSPEPAPTGIEQIARAAGIQPSQVFSHREYPDKLVVVTRAGQKITIPKDRQS